jgi:hypothetical protein
MQQRLPRQSDGPTVLCEVNSVVTEFMVRMQQRLPRQSDGPAVLCDVVSVVAEFGCQGNPMDLQCYHMIYRKQR